MTLLKRRVVSSEIEEKILTGMIVSDSFCRDMIKVLDGDSFETPFIARVTSWVLDYYWTYKKAPSSHISDIYKIEKNSLYEEEATAIEMLLSSLSDKFEDQGFNEEYLKDTAFEYLRHRTIKLFNDRISGLVEVNRLDEAETEIRNFKKAALLTSKWENVFDLEVIKNFYQDEDTKKHYLFTLPGDVGRFLGPFERNWLIGIMAPSKKGKSFWLIEIALQAAFCGLRVVFISLEMSAHQIKRRFYRRLTAMADVAKDYVYPCFDCGKNQAGVCNLSQRTNNVRLLDSENKKPKYNRDMAYQPCTACRHTNPRNYVMATWYTTIHKDKRRTSKAIKTITAQGNHFGNHLEMIAYPSYSANISRVMSDIGALQDAKDFTPDLIIIDYADILAPEDARVTGRDRIDETWKTLKRAGDEMHCCVVTASQSNRQSFEKKNVTQVDVSEDIRKIANSNLFLAINQTPQEKKESCCRLAKVAAREDGFDQYDGVVVLQQLGLGQISLDSALIEPPDDGNEYENEYAI